MAAKPKYKASRDYGTRGAEREAFKIQFAGKFATIYRRKDSESLTWHMRVFVRGDDYRVHYRKSLRTTDRREAQEFAQREFIDLMVKRQQGLRVVSKTFMEACRAYKLHEDKELEAGVMRKQTHALHHFYTQRGIQYAKDKFPAGVNTRLTNINGKTHFADYLDWRLALGDAKRSTVQAELEGIRRIFQHAVKLGWANDKCVPQWDLGKIEQSKRAPLNMNDYPKALRIMKAWTRKASSSPVDIYNRELLHHIFLLMADTGMRTGEVLKLRNSDIQSIDRDKLEVSISIRAAITKTKKARNLTLLPSFGGRDTGTPINYLLRWLDKHQRHKQPDDYIFALFTKGTGEARDAFYRSYMSLRDDLKAESLEHFDAYYLRHYYATKAIIAGHPLTAISNALGNSTAVLEKTYSHLLSEHTSRQIAESRQPNKSL